MSRRVLMCEPLHFRIEYEINPWMRRANQVRGADGVRRELELYLRAHFG